MRPKFASPIPGARHTARIRGTRFFQLYFTTKKKGSGIGLAMTFRIVQVAPW
jgi:signal transduction histidine kinase